MRAASISDFRKLAQRRLPHFLFEYIDGGSYDEVTVARNIQDLKSVTLRQRTLNDVSSIDLSKQILGRQAALPVILGPIGLAGMNARRGEVQAARAAEGAGVPFCLSTVSACSIEEVRAATAVPFWFQLYMIRDRGFMAALLERAWSAGCRQLVFTIDMPLPGARYRDIRSGLSGSRGIGGSLRRTMQALRRPHWAYDVGLRGRPHQLGNVAPILGMNSGLEDFLGWMRDNFDPSVTWSDLEWVKARWQGEIILKGVLDPDDAKAAAAVGVDGIVVSNHGGRQLDGVTSTRFALPRVRDAIGNATSIFVDGGARSGLDIVRFLSLGADAVLLGRAWAFALAAAGEAGVTHLLDLIAAEMRVAMALTGVSKVGDLSQENIDWHDVDKRNQAASVTS